MNTSICAGRGNPRTKKPPTDNNWRRWGSELKSQQPPPRNNLEIQLKGGEITQNKQLNNHKTEASKPRKTEETASTQPVHTCTTEYKMWWVEWPSAKQVEGRTHQKKTQQQSKPKDIQIANINDSPRAATSGDQGHCTTESHRSPTIEVHTTNSGI